MNEHKPRVPVLPHSVLERLQRLYGLLMLDTVSMAMLANCVHVKELVNTKAISYDDVETIIKRLEDDVNKRGLTTLRQFAIDLAWDILFDIPIPYVLPQDPINMNDHKPRVPVLPSSMLPRLRNLRSLLLDEKMSLAMLYPVLILRRAYDNRELSFDEMQIVIQCIEGEICRHGLTATVQKAIDLAWDILADIPVPYTLVSNDSAAL